MVEASAKKEVATDSGQITVNKMSVTSISGVEPKKKEVVLEVPKAKSLDAEPEKLFDIELSKLSIMVLPRPKEETLVK